MTEVSYSGKYHRQTQPVGSFDDFLIAYRSAGLNNGSGTSLGDLLDSVRKREKCVGGGHRSF